VTKFPNETSFSRHQPQRGNEYLLELQLFCMKSHLRGNYEHVPY
jgi:hypothetical protein